MTTLDPLPKLYATYSDKMDSEDHENIVVCGQGDEGEQGKSELYKSDSTHISVSIGSQHLDTSTPWGAALPDDTWRAECGSDITNTSDLFSDMSEPCLARLDFSQPPSVAIGNKPCAAFASKNPNLRYQTHPKINGEILFIPNISATNFVDKENLVNKMVAT